MNEFKTCLLLEDDPDDQDFFVDSLHAVSSRTGCLIACNGEEALLMLRDDGLRPDYIFTDLNMPRMDGYEFIRILKRTNELKNIPVVVYSSNCTITDLRKLKEMGVQACYSKLCFKLLPEILRQYFGEPASTVNLPVC